MMLVHSGALCSRPKTQLTSLFLVQCPFPPAPRPARSRRNLYTNSRIRRYNEQVKSVAILGGGLTGLTTAFYLTKCAPRLPITLYESSPRLGGWVHTHHLNTPEGRVVFETGPRTIRPNLPAGIVTIDLIHQLDILKTLVGTTIHAPASRNRYVFHDSQLVRLPTGIGDAWGVRKHPIFEGLSSVLREVFRSRPKDLSDESIGSFISRRFHPKLKDNIASAIVHGIYAGDIDKLSMKSCFNQPWEMERQCGSITKAILQSRRDRVLTTQSEQWIKDSLLAPNRFILAKLAATKVVSYTFFGGLGTLTDELKKYLEKAPSVTIRTNATVKSVKIRDDTRRPLQIQLTNNLPPASYSHVISTLFAPTTSSLLPIPVPSFSTLEAVTVQVVNLFFKTPNLVPRAFGYLIPKNVAAEQNPTQALGVIFDSEISAGNEHFDPRPFDIAPGTKLTILFGGHYWDGRTSFPTEKEALKNAQHLLATHLGILEKPELTMVSLHKNCIPQYTVGHHDRMEFAHELLKIQFNGRFAVAGSSYAGVGVNDCTRSAYEVVNKLLLTGNKSMGGLEPGEWTGLESFALKNPSFWTTNQSEY